MIDAQGQIDHLPGFGNDFGTAAETRENMADVAVVRLDRKGQVCAGEELVFGDETVKAAPVVGEDGLALEADFIEELLTEMLWGERRENGTIVAAIEPTTVPHATGQ
jgi:hypothetical protein